MKYKKLETSEYKKLKGYFEERDLGLSNKKLDNCKYKIYKIFDKDTTRATRVELIPLLKDSKKELKFILKKLREEDPDKRRGWVTYGYDNIQGDLDYISDRWNCSFRVQWMLDLFDKKGGGF